MTEADIRRIVREEIATIEAERRTPEARQAQADRLISAFREAGEMAKRKVEGGSG